MGGVVGHLTFPHREFDMPTFLHFLNTISCSLPFALLPFVYYRE
jgi:hypothetical protein